MSHSVSTLNKSIILRAMVMVSLYWFSMYVYLPYTATFLKEGGTGQTMIGLVAGAYGFAQIILRPPLGIAADLNGKLRIFILCGVSIPALASMVRLIMPAAEGFLLANLLSGCGAAMWICFMVYFAVFFGKDGMQQATALIMGANGFGQLIGYIVSTLLYTKLGMPVLCVASIVASILATVIALTLHPEKSISSVDFSNISDSLPLQNTDDNRCHVPSVGKLDHSPSNDKPDISLRLNDLFKVFRNKRLLVFSIFGFMQTGIALATVTNFDTQRMRNFGGSNAMVGLMTIIFMTFQMIFSIWSATPAFRRYGSKTWLPLSLTSAGIYCLASALSSQPWQLFTIQVFSGFYAGVITSFAMAEGLKEIPSVMRTTAVGIYQCFVAMGIALIPLISGRLADLTDNLLTPYYVFAIVSFICAAIAGWATRTDRLNTHPPLRSFYEH